MGGVIAILLVGMIVIPGAERKEQELECKQLAQQISKGSAEVYIAEKRKCFNNLD